MSSISDEQLHSLVSTAPTLYDYGGTIIVRLSKFLVLKGGFGIPSHEAENQKFAQKSLNLPVPNVHRIFATKIPGIIPTELVTAHFFVMDYVPGPTVEECWESLDHDTRTMVVRQVADIIDRMQSTPFDKVAPGPILADQTQKFEGPWFTHAGVGPFGILEDLEGWCNHKTDVCIKFQQLPSDTPRFRFQKLVFSHQDIAPRNLILDPQGKVWLIDWSWAGFYPPGFDQAVLPGQSKNIEFTDLVLGSLSNQCQDIIDLFDSITFGLTTAAAL